MLTVRISRRYACPSSSTYHRLKFLHALTRDIGDGYGTIVIFLYPVRREFMAQDFEEIARAGVTPPQQVRELADDICSAFGIGNPVLFNE